MWRHAEVVGSNPAGSFSPVFYLLTQESFKLGPRDGATHFLRKIDAYLVMKQA